jgi:hypothetical protein
MPAAGLRDADIRRALERELRRTHGRDPQTLIVHELGLCQGAARVDMALINSTVNGFEIKSQLDTLHRLPGQQRVYEQALDSITVVAGERHVGPVMEKLPDWWGVWSARRVKRTIRFEVIREADENPNVDPLSMVQLLWRDEALAALKERALDRGVRTKARKLIWKRLATSLSPDDLRAVVRRCLIARGDWRS